MKFEPTAAPGSYDRNNEASFRDLLRRYLTNVLRSDRDAELQPNTRLIMTDDNGQRWAFTVDTSGNLVSTAL